MKLVIVMQNIYYLWFDVVLILKWIKNFDMICLFVELFVEMVLIVDVSDGLDQKIIKIIVFIDSKTDCW